LDPAREIDALQPLFHDASVSVFIDERFEPLFERDPLVLVDVGARGGLRPNWRQAERHLRIVGFEPEADEFQRLDREARASGGRTRFFHAALHNRAGAVPLHVARDRGLTSIFEPNRPFLNAFPEAERFDTVAVAEVMTDTLDHVLETGQVHDVDFVKVDTQGSELFVLQGGENTLRKTVVGVEVEVEFAPVYNGQPLFAEVDTFLRGLGFSLFDLRPCYWKRSDGTDLGGPQGQLIWADALYLRELSSLRQLLDGFNAAQRPAKLLKALSVSVLYGYFDYAVAMLGATQEILSAEDRQAARSALASGGQPHDPMPAFPGRSQVARAARRLWKLSAERNAAWSISDAELGNPR
jgi:FkbM family methyltransferase